jgi:hypothetical protein
MKPRILCLGAAALALFALGSAQAADLVKGELKPCLHDGTNVGEVNSCGKIWKLKSGRAHVNSNGELNAEVKGLVLNDATVGEFNGTPDGVDAVAAAVVCDGKVVAQADPVPLSKAGDARVQAKVKVPAECKGGAIVLRASKREGRACGMPA